MKGDIQAKLNRIFLDGRIIEQQKYGIVLRINKTDFPTTPAN